MTWAIMSLLVFSSCKNNSVIIKDLRCEYLNSPINIDERNPRFTWTYKLDKANYVQQAYKLDIALSKKDLEEERYLWTSGKTVSNTNRTEYTGNRELEPHTKYYWRVSSWDKNNRITTSGIQSFETALLEGSLEVESNQTKEKVILIPGSYAYAREGILTSDKFRNMDQFLWKEGIIAFEEETVRDIFDKLELYYDVKIEVKNSNILNFPYTGKFRTNDGVEHALHVLQLRHKFSYTKDNESNIIVIR